MPLNVRRAVAGDEKAVAAFLVKLVRQHVGYDPHRFSDFVTAEGAAAFYAGRFEAENSRVLIVEADGKPVGFAYLEFEERNYEELVDRGVWLHDIFVQEEFRSTGVGKTLMKASIAAAAELGGSKLLLGTAAQNTVARTFFESFGFRTTMIEMTLNLDQGAR
jgi:GNAT superfamily N-acetyltransferase